MVWNIARSRMFSLPGCLFLSQGLVLLCWGLAKLQHAVPPSWASSFLQEVLRQHGGGRGSSGGGGGSRGAGGAEGAGGARSEGGVVSDGQTEAENHKDGGSSPLGLRPAGEDGGDVPLDRCAAGEPSVRSVAGGGCDQEAARSDRSDGSGAAGASSPLSCGPFSYGPGWERSRARLAEADEKPGEVRGGAVE